MTKLIVALDDDQMRLLLAVAAGEVARHRRNSVTSVHDGEDWWVTGAGEHRRARNRLRPLVKAGLVEWRLPRTAPADADSWPWEVTTRGDRIIEEARALAAEQGEVLLASDDRAGDG